MTVSLKADNDRALVAVADDGDGVAEADLPHVFERCYKGKGGNFGIGLALARTAADRMGGTLAAANRVEGGAVFTLTLQLVEKENGHEKQ